MESPCRLEQQQSCLPGFWLGTAVFIAWNFLMNTQTSPFQMLQNKGVKFHMKTELCELKGKDGKVSPAFVIPELLILGGKKAQVEI